MANDQIKSRILESSTIEKTILVTEEMLGGVFLYAPLNGLKLTLFHFLTKVDSEVESFCKNKIMI